MLRILAQKHKDNLTKIFWSSRSCKCWGLQFKKNEKDLDRATNLNLHEETIICESRLNKIGLFYLQYKKKERTQQKSSVIEKVVKRKRITFFFMVKADEFEQEWEKKGKNY